MSHAPQPRPEPNWLSVTEYAASYGIDRSTVYKWLAAQLLETYREGTILRIKNLPIDQHQVPRNS